MFKPAQKDLYIVGKQGTADHPNYNTDCIVDDVHAFTELMDKEGYKFDFQDDGGFHYYHPMTGEDIWWSRIYLKREKDSFFKNQHDFKEEMNSPTMLTF